MFHPHVEHTGDLHANHSPCQVCRASTKLFQSVLPVPNQEIILSQIVVGEISYQQASNFFYQLAYSHHSRAPPL